MKTKRSLIKLASDWPLRRIVTALLSLAVCLPAFGTRIIPVDQTLNESLRASDFVVVATCTATQEISAAFYRLSFAVSRQLKGQLPAFTIQAGSRTTAGFEVLVQPRPCLVFLQRSSDPASPLPVLYGVIALDGLDASLPSALQRKLEIDAMPVGAAKTDARKQFSFPLLAAPGQSLLKETAAEDLCELYRQDPQLRLSAAEEILVLHEATNTASYKLAVPLSLLLVNAQSPAADPACLHALLKTDALAGDEWFRLAPVLADRPALRERFVEAMEGTADANRLGQMLPHLHLVPERELTNIFDRVWRSNPAGRSEIRHVLRQPTATPAQKDLLRRLGEN